MNVIHINIILYANDKVKVYIKASTHKNEYICLKYEYFRILSDARGLSTFPSLNGTSALDILRLDRAGITSVPSTLCYTCPRLRIL